MDEREFLKCADKELARIESALELCDADFDFELKPGGVLELEFLVPSRWLMWLRVGGAFKVTIDETRKTYPAKFIRIGARVDPVSQSVKVVAAIDGRFPELVSGMSGRVQVASP